MSELGLHGSEAQQRANAIEESLASGHLSTQKLQDYQDRVKAIAKIDQPVRAVAGALGAPFLIKGIERNIDRVGEALSRKATSAGQELLTKTLSGVRSAIDELPSGIGRAFAQVPGLHGAVNPAALGDVANQLNVAPARAAAQAGLAQAGADAQTAARVAAAKGANAFSAGGDFLGQGDQAVARAAAAAPRGVVPGADLGNEARGMSNLARLRAGKGLFGNMGESVGNKVGAAGRAAAAQAEARASLLPTQDAAGAAKALTSLTGSADVAKAALSGPEPELANAVSRLTIRPAGGLAQAGLGQASDFGQTAGPLAKALELDPERSITGDILTQVQQAPPPGTRGILGAARDTLGSARNLMNADLTGQMQSGLQAGKELAAGVNPMAGGPAAANALGGAADTANDALAGVTGAAKGVVASAQGSAEQTSSDILSQGAKAAATGLKTTEDIVDTAAAAQGGADIFADVGALALGLATVLPSILVPTPEVAPPKPPVGVGTAAPIGV